MKNYIEAVSVADGFKGRVYTYDNTGNKPVVVWLSPESYGRLEEAIDAAYYWCEEHDVDAELG